MRSTPRARNSPVRISLCATAVLGLVVTGTSPAAAADDSTAPPNTVHVVSQRMPATGPVRELAADRSSQAIDASRTAAQPAPSADPNPWEDIATMPGVVKDVDFVTPRIGYAAAELGIVWKTTDGGKTWTKIVDEGFPLYFYGVAALSKDEVVVSGFDNAAFTAVVWRTLDGGATWDSGIAFEDNWAQRVRYSDHEHGLIAGIIGSETWATSTGGETADEWTSATADPDQGWIGAQFTLLKSERAYLSGIAFCKSKTGGFAWACEHSVDDVFDGPARFENKKVGWVGGGSISPTVEGWLHRTTDGGKTWSERTLQGDWPVRHIESISKDVVWAAAGDAFSGNGGMYASTDGGQTWTVDLESGMEMTSCDHLPAAHGSVIRITCIGYANDGAWTSKAYRLDVPAETALASR